MVQKG
jgi:hypothetical protein